MNFNNKTPLSFTVTSCLILVLLGLNVAALETDKSSPIFIEANQVAMSEGTGVSTYSGNVKLEQGSIKILAESIVIYTNNKKLRRIIATGKPAYFSQQPKPKAEPVKASANHVEYDSTSGILVLLDDAKMTQGSNLFSGNKIEYDTNNNILTAKSLSKNKQRVKAVIQANTFREAD